MKVGDVEAELHLHTGCDGEKRPGDERREVQRQRSLQTIPSAQLSWSCLTAVAPASDTHTHTRLKVVAGNQNFTKPISEPESRHADLLISRLQTFLSDLHLKSYVIGLSSGDEKILLTADTPRNVVFMQTI